jgi:hypothetical protein
METDSSGDAPRRPRLRAAGSPLRRAGGAVAALAAVALLAGCGTASSSGSSTNGAASTNTTSGFNPALVPAGGSAPGKNFKQGGATTGTTAGSKKGTSKSASQGSSSTSGTGGSSSAPAPAPAPAPAQTRTVTVSHTSTVTHTVTRTKYVHVRPSVPAGASLPSTAKPLAVSHFDAEGGHIGCRISGGVARCDVAGRYWRAPRKPSSCHAAWAPGLFVGPKGSAGFVCARSSVLDPTGTYIRAGFDDKVGNVTCQVRHFGVTCYEPDGRGFTISRAGYLTF